MKSPKNIYNTTSEAKVDIPDITHIENEWEAFKRKHIDDIFRNEQYKLANHKLDRNVKK